MAQLVNTSMLRVGWPASPCCRWRPEVSSAPVAMALRSRACSRRASGGGRAEQGDVAGRNPVGDAAEAFVVLGAEHGTAGDRHAHARIQFAGRQRCLPKRGSGQVAQAQAGELSIHVGDVPALPSSTPHIGRF